MGFRKIIGWLFIFIIGSLIVTYIISPNSFNSFLENIRGLKGAFTFNENNYIKLEQEASCSMLEILGEMWGVANIKGKECTSQCGLRNYSYYMYKCVKNKLICYCEK